MVFFFTSFHSRFGASCRLFGYLISAILSQEKDSREVEKEPFSRVLFYIMRARFQRGNVEPLTFTNWKNNNDLENTAINVRTPTVWMPKHIEWGVGSTLVVGSGCRYYYNLWLYHFPLTINKTLQIILVHLPACIIKRENRRANGRAEPNDWTKYSHGSSEQPLHIPHWKTKFHIHANERKNNERTKCDFMCFVLLFGLISKAFYNPHEECELEKNANKNLHSLFFF